MSTFRFFLTLLWCVSSVYRAAVTRVEAAPPDVLDARDFGTLGDGKANDGPALQRAFDAAGKQGLPLVIPRGDYLVDGNPILVAGVDGLAVRGPGRLVYGTGLYRSGLNCPLLDFRQCSDLTLEGLSFLGTGQARGFVGYEAGCRVACDGPEADKQAARITVRDCRFEGFRGCALLVSSGVFGPANVVRPVPGLRTADVLVTGCRFQSNSVAFLTKPGGVARLRFLQNHVAGGGLGGIKLDGEGQAGPTPAGPALVSGNTFDDFDSAYCPGQSLQGPIVVEEGMAGVSISGNLFTRVKAPNAGALWIDTGQTVRDVADVTFAGNVASDISARSLVRLSTTGAGKISGVTVQANMTTRAALLKGPVLNEAGSAVSRLALDPK